MYTAYFNCRKRRYKMTTLKINTETITYNQEEGFIIKQRNITQESESKTISSFLKQEKLKIKHQSWE